MVAEDGQAEIPRTNKGEKGMSEETCQGCGKPKDQCTCVTAKEVVQTIRVEHVGLPKGKGTSKGSETEEDLKAKLDEREEQLKVIALKELDKEKKALLETIQDPNKRAYVDQFIGEDPEKLEQVKVNLALLGKALGIGGIKISGEDDDDDGTEPVPPAGSARAPPKPNLLGTGLEQIDRIYNTLESKTATEEQKAEARRRADQMVEQFIQGRRKAIREDPQHKYYVGYVMCPKCGKSIFVSKGTKRVKQCPHCNAILTKRAE